MEEIIKEYEEKEIKVIKVKETDKTILYNIIIVINEHEIIEDFEILKEMINNKEIIYNTINYLLHNAFSRYLSRK